MELPFQHFELGLRQPRLELRGAQLALREAAVVAPRFVRADEDPVREEPEIQMRDRDALEAERLLVDQGDEAEPPPDQGPQSAEHETGRHVDDRGTPPRAAVEAEVAAHPEDERGEDQPRVPGRQPGQDGLEQGQAVRLHPVGEDHLQRREHAQPRQDGHEGPPRQADPVVRRGWWEGRCHGFHDYDGTTCRAGSRLGQTATRQGQNACLATRWRGSDPVLP